MNILFMCVANSARSQLAEALAREVLGPGYLIESAGSHPTRPNPLAIEVLAERGIDIRSARSKALTDLSPAFLAPLQYVITLCAEEVCPVLPSKATKLHWPLPDPGHSIEAFRATRDEIERRLIDWKATLGAQGAGQ